MSKPLAVERSYESLFIIPSDTSQKTIDGLIEKIKNAIAPSKGILRSVQVWGRRRLTYPIKHQRDGLYIFIDFTGENGSPEGLKNLFRVTDYILRYMVTDKVVLNPPVVRKPPTAEGVAAAPAPAATATSDSQVKSTPSA